MRRLYLLILFLFTTSVAFGDAVVFNGDYVKTLKAQVNLFDEAYILTGTADPTAVATTAPKGSLYLRQTAAGNGALFIKLDNGSSTNWSGPVATGTGNVVGPASATDNALVRFDSTTGKLIKNSLAILDNSGNLSGIADFTATGTVTINTGLTGPLKAAAGVVSASAINLASEVTGVLPIANGGTNSSTALNNNRVIQSSGGKIQEAAAITASRALASDTNGIPVASTTTATQLGYLDTATSNIQTQIDAKEPSFSILPVAKGGTNSGTTLNNNRFVISSGGAIVENSAVTASRALASDSNGLPVASTTTATQLGYLDTATSNIQTQLGTKAIGAASSTTNAVPSFSGTDGKTLQNTAAILTTGGALSGLTQLDVDNVRTDLNTISTTNTNGNLVLTPNGTGRTTTSKGVDFTAASGFRLYDTDDSNYVEFKPNGTTTGNYTQTWPAAQPIAETSLKDDGSGALKSDFISTEVNLILNAFGAQDTNGYTASGAGIAVARTTTASDLPLGSIYGSAIKITPASGTDYVSYCFTLPEALASTKLQAQWQQRPLAGYASGDLKFDVYSYAGAACTSTATRVALSTDTSAVTAIPNSTGTFRTTFDTSTTAAAPSYQIRFVRVAGTTAINFTNINVGPGVSVQGAVVTAPQTCTVTGSWVSNTTYTCLETRVGNFATYQIKAATSGAPTSATLEINLPSGRTIDTTAMTDSGSTIPWVGQGVAFDNGNADYGIAIVYKSTTSVRATTLNWTSNSIRVDSVVNQGTPFTFGSGDFVNINFTVPIAEWAGSGTVNLGSNGDEFVYNTDTSNADNTTAFGYGPGGIAFGSYTGGKNKTVRFQTPIQPTDFITIEVNAGTNWMPFYANNAGSLAYTAQNSVKYGMWLSQSSITDVIVGFGNYYSPTGASFGAVGGPWSGLVTWKWRVRKSASGQAVGFGLATATQSGLLPPATSMDDTLATALGYKTYSHGTTYNGGIAPTITAGCSAGTLSSVSNSYFVPYKMQNGTWRMKFNITLVMSTTARTYCDFSVNGISGMAYQSIVGDGGVTGVAYHSYAVAGAFSVGNASTSTTDYTLSGDVFLASKPTWAY
jgi:hypothetical protein